MVFAINNVVLINGYDLNSFYGMMQSGCSVGVSRVVSCAPLHALHQDFYPSGGTSPSRMHAHTWNSNTQLTISGLSSHSLSPSFEYGLVGDDASISSRLEFASFSSMPYQLAVIASMYVCIG